jgi:3-dehydroquinate synthetase
LPEEGQPLTDLSLTERHLSVDAATVAEYCLDFVPDMPAAIAAAVVRACGGPTAVLLVSSPQPAPAEHALWEALDANRPADGLRAVTRMQLPCRDRGFDAVQAVVRAAISARLARHDAFVTSGDPHTVQITTLAAAIFRRHTTVVQVITNLAALADVLLRGWHTTLAGEPVALLVQRVVALADADSLARAAPVSRAEADAIGALAARMPGIGGLGRKLAGVADPDEARRLRLALLAVISRDWPSALPTGPDRSPVRKARATTLPRRRPDSPQRIVHGVRPMSFPVVINEGILDPMRSSLADHLPVGARVLAVVDDYSAATTAAVGFLLGTYQREGHVRGYEVDTLNASPATKVLPTVRTLLTRAERLGLGPDDRIIAVGGGTVMDTVGFAAALYHGATSFIRIPSTLVGLVDAGVGFKVGVDAEGHRNLLGAYRPPAACLCDPGFLHTLPSPELRCGLAEMIKIAAVRDGELFGLIEDGYDEVLERRIGPAVTDLIYRSIVAMVTDLVRNPCETELRRLPDFGHEFGHMLETASGRRLRHGEAVAIGMALSCELATSTGWLAREDADRIIGLLQRAGLPVYDACCDPVALWHRLRDDVLPHKGGHLHLAVPTGIGSGGFIEPLSAIELPLLERACQQLRLRADAWAARRCVRLP